ncbi:ankyrin repeat domain-containing protein 66 [Lingula anatina]|uniref:Ankyrin repeat domain-containing protein 66 n=1 Tax=Lingula anatina TaxID=7574 RepID=A0A1S3H3N4_LINAN|nr:ankyrin repeat domain-containing protein 66 [Lingula anatina]|eukprot:XP_013379749.1 ankyrin repeat domain-containing protein 66 [Lingula anatina]
MAGLELHEAVAAGDYDAVEELLNSGKVDVNLKDVEWKFKTPLHWACSKGSADIIRLLLEHKAKGTARMAGRWTPAHCAAESGKVHALRALHMAGVSVWKKNASGETPLTIAEVNGNADCVKFLTQVMAGKVTDDVDDDDDDDDNDNEHEHTENTDET